MLDFVQTTILSGCRTSPQTSEVFETSEVSSPRRGLRLAMTGTVLACLLLVAASNGAEPASGPPSASSAPQGLAAVAEQAFPAKVRRYAERLLRQYDRNGDGVLQPEEWSKMHGNPGAIDVNRDRSITLDELTRHIIAYGEQRRVSLASPGVGGNSDASATPVDEVEPDGASPGGPAEGKGTLSAASPGAERESPRKPRESTFYVRPSRLPPGLPEWFVRRDLNGDGQLSLSEFAPNPTQADLEEFARSDKNDDGFITAQECLDALSPAKSAVKKKPSGKSAGKSAEKADAAEPKETGGTK
jgi:hypothetical protein